MVAGCMRLIAMLVTFPIGNDGIRDPQMVAGCEAYSYAGNLSYR